MCILQKYFLEEGKRFLSEKLKWNFFKHLNLKRSLYFFSVVTVLWLYRTMSLFLGDFCESIYGWSDMSTTLKTQKKDKCGKILITDESLSMCIN